ncbi:MAG: phosphatase PAP2 family protein [Rickettsiales bacterium]|jgi:membrane-associated phospholipid phosphatase|nr:phosphatase PAP2 family protein [Rickettsiales bacterium]
MFLNKNNSLNWKKMAIAGLVVAALCALGILWLDAPLYMWLRNFYWAGWGVFDVVFESEHWIAASLIVAIIIFVMRDAKRETRENAFRISHIASRISNNPAAMVFCSVAGASVITGVLKVLIGRMRPVFYEALGQTGFYPWNFEWAFNSMPSGHTTASFAGLVMIGLIVTRNAKRETRDNTHFASRISHFVLWSLAIIIGLSRIAHGVHWPSDVLLGAFIGMVAADVVKAYVIGHKA